MDIKSYFSTPAQLERTSFLWSEARLLVAAAALFLGGIPPVVYVLGNDSLIWSLLKIAWIASGAASAYLGYRWYISGQRVFGGKDQKDVAAFAVSVLSGLNLGWTGLSGNNIGMSISYSKTAFLITGVIYVLAAYQLWRRWKASSERLF
jgi:hypothetical protein